MAAKNKNTTTTKTEETNTKKVRQILQQCMKMIQQTQHVYDEQGSGPMACVQNVNWRATVRCYDHAAIALQ